MDNLVPYNEAMDALRRLALKYRNKEATLLRPADRKFAKGKAELYESILYYLDLRNAKRDIQRPSREEVPQSVDLPVRRGKECPITGYRG